MCLNNQISCSFLIEFKVKKYLRNIFDDCKNYILMPKLSIKKIKNFEYSYFLLK